MTHLTDKELRYKYRPEGWTIQQVVGHCVDSHMNSIIRFKLALTEDTPTIKPYDEAPVGRLTDTVNYSIQSSTTLLAGIHQRWVFLLEQLDDSQLKRTYLHPEGNELVTLEEGWPFMLGIAIIIYNTLSMRKHSNINQKFHFSVRYLYPHSIL